MRIFIRPPDKGKKDDVEFDINPDELIESVRRRVQEKRGFECHKLIYRGVTLRDDRTLRFYDAAEGSTLIVQAQYYGQYMPMGVTPQMEKQMEKRTAEDADLDASVDMVPEPKRVQVGGAAQDVTTAKIPWIGACCASYGEKGMRRQMEDEHLICTSLMEQCAGLNKVQDFALFAVFDGHGGRQVAEFVKTYLPAELGNAIVAEEGPNDVRLSDKRVKKVIESSFQRLDSRIAVELPGCYDGSTAVVVLSNETEVFCANLGDSMAYLCRRTDEGELQPIPLQMRQHKCWMMKEKERILRSGGAVENGRINGVLEVSRAFGDITLKKYGVLCTPEYMKFKVDREKDQFVLLGSDGFWSAWTASEALEFTLDLVEAAEALAAEVDDPVDIPQCCKTLVEHVIEEKKAQDNVSVLLVRFTQLESMVTQ